MKQYDKYGSFEDLYCLCVRIFKVWDKLAVVYSKPAIAVVLTVYYAFANWLKGQLIQIFRMQGLSLLHIVVDVF